MTSEIGEAVKGLDALGAHAYIVKCRGRWNLRFTYSSKAWEKSGHKQIKAVVDYFTDPRTRQAFITQMRSQQAAIRL
jgi:hypothetical protein